MHADEPYADYVAARWSTIYRLAVLLVGEEQADDLAQEALVRAYLDWSREQDDEPPEEQVKAILARRALAEPAREPTADSPWAAIGSLSQAERVVLVLRCYEYLDDGDIARALGVGHDVVTDAGLALGSLPMASTEVSAMLIRAADQVGVPLPPVESLLARGHEARRRRTRRRLRWTAVTVAGLLVALAAGTYLQAHPLWHRGASAGSFPGRLADLRRGAEPRAVYAELDTLHLGGGRYAVLESVPSGLVQAGRWTYAFLPSGAIDRVDDRSLKVLPVTDAAMGPPVADRLGRYVAWLATYPGRPLVVVRPTDPAYTNSRAHEHRFPAAGGPPEVVGITPAGDVVAASPRESRAWVWRSEDVFFDQTQAVREIEGLGNGVVTQVTPSEIVAQYGSNHFAVGRIDHDAFLAEEDLVATAADFADPTGRRIVYLDGSGAMRVGRRGAGSGSDRSHDLRLRMPRLRVGYAALVWEDDRHVLLDVSDDSLPHGAVVRCDVGTGTCELAHRFDQTLHLLAR